VSAIRVHIYEDMPDLALHYKFRALPSTPVHVRGFEILTTVNEDYPLGRHAVQFSISSPTFQRNVLPSI
jgi:hypothetical protein